MKREEVDQTGAETLAKMMELAVGEQELWESAELAAILEHQLAAPLEIDLGSIDPAWPVRLASPASSGPPLGTFRDLFHHPEPPLELLDLTKRFAKRCRTDADCPLPGEIATVLYFLAIGVARCRAGQRISGLDDDSLRHAMQWSIAQPWVDDDTRQLFRESLSALG
ncbi:MAG: hypothetical protein HUU20_27420 [Pirellulales bacterium]|nr:hypothetical protein [Pirellulales bacterium]